MKIRKEIIVLAGKGGTGKTTVTWNIAISLRKMGYEVAILDIDISNPNLPQVSGIGVVPIQVINDQIQPIIHESGLKLVSVGFEAPSSVAILWSENRKTDAVNQLYSQVAWGDSDFLLIDAPAGTGGEITRIMSLFQEKEKEYREKYIGAIVVTNPHPSAITDAERAIDMIYEKEIPFLGTIMNMAKFVCPQCHHEEKYYPQNWQRVKPVLNDFPYDPNTIHSNYLNFNHTTEKILKKLGKTEIKPLKTRKQKLKQSLIKKGVEFVS